MKATPRLWTAALVVGLQLAATTVNAQVTAADYDRALGLRERWQYLTDNLADPATWIGKTSRFYYRKTVLRGGHQFVVVDAMTLEKRPAFDHEKLAASLSKETGEKYTALRLPFATIRFSDDERSVEMNVRDGSWTCRLSDYACVKRESPRSGSGQPRSFGVVRDLEVPADNRPKRSPDGRWEAFVHNRNVAVRRVGSRSPIVLSTDGSDGNFYDPQSIVWSPDSSKLVAYRVRPGYRRLVHYVESSPKDQVQPKHLTQVYIKPGDAIDLDQPVVFHVEPARQLTVANDLMLNPLPLSRPAWRQDSRTLTFEYTQRGYQVARVIEVDAGTGKARALITERSDTLIGGRRFRQEVNGGREIIWLSERDGWHHLYLYDGATGQMKNQVTKGEWIVRDVEKVDEDKRQIWFSASGMYPGKDPYLVHYYRINFDGSGLITLTKADANHDVSFSADMNYFVDTYSRVDLPNVSELRRTSDLSLVAELERADISALTAAGFKPPEVFTAKGRDGKTEIWGIIVRPTNFDPSKKYPVVENIYAAAYGSYVPKTFWPFGAHSSGDKVIGMQSQAEVGFIVVMIEGMGSLNRSKAFLDVAWKNIGDAGFPDRIK
jgi:dipeptidyl aminopeptidase/acylaminoacyl peptidase